METRYNVARHNYKSDDNKLEYFSRIDCDVWEWTSSQEDADHFELNAAQCLAILLFQKEGGTYDYGIVAHPRLITLCEF